MTRSHTVRWIAGTAGLALGLPMMVGAQGGFGFGGVRQELELVKQYDANKDKRLGAQGCTRGRAQSGRGPSLRPVWREWHARARTLHDPR